MVITNQEPVTDTHKYKQWKMLKHNTKYKYKVTRENTKKKKSV